MTRAPGASVTSAMSGATFSAPLIQELTSRDYRRRADGCAELGMLLRDGHLSACGRLLEHLADNHPVVRVTAAESLAMGPGELTERALLEALEALPSTARAGHRASVVHALGLLTSPCEGPLADALLAELDHAETDVRFHALAALNRLDCDLDRFDRKMPVLLRDPDPEVAAVAATAAADFGRKDLLEAIVGRWRTARGFARRHLALAAAHLGSDEVLSSLERATRDGVDALNAIDALIALGTPAAARQLSRTAKTRRPHPIVRARAAIALLELGEVGAAALVRKNLNSRRKDVRWSTIEFLGRTHQVAFLDDLRSRLLDPRSQDAAVAATALGALGTEAALAALRRAAAEDKRSDVREEAQAALSAHDRDAKAGPATT